MLKDKIDQLRLRIAAAAQRSGRDPDDITLIAVTKTFPVAAVLDAVSCGLCDIAESRIQEAQEKFAVLDRSSVPLRTHLIGHLQTNKAKKAVALFDIIQSVDSYRLAEEICRQAGRIGKVQDCLAELKVSPEESKFGLAPEEMGAFFQECRNLAQIRLTGLMVMAPYAADPEQARPYFRKAKAVFDVLCAAGRIPAPAMLSMGMSHDFEVAIEEGATLVRIGTALFGDRHYGTQTA
jgi:pyridoxal phosphate enzyme (YggS family)